MLTRSHVKLRRRAAAALALLGLATVLMEAPASTSEMSGVNAARATAGLAPLARVAALDLVAGRHSQEMAERGVLFHAPDLGRVLDAVVPGLISAGENVGVGASVEEVTSRFMSSPTHRAQILGDFDRAGFGVAGGRDGRVWVTQIFSKAVAGAVEPSASTIVPVAPSTGVPVVPSTRISPIPARSGIVGSASAPNLPHGYWLAGADGGAFALGTAGFAGAIAGRSASPIVDVAASRDGGGYWMAGADGGVFAFGTARYAGSMGGRGLTSPVTSMVGTPDGNGYWLAAADGGVFAFGDAIFSGSMAGRPLRAPVVAMARTPSGAGYWLVNTLGEISAFGDAPEVGSLGGRRLNAPIVGISSSPSGRGYLLAAADGGVFAFGDAVFVGGMGGQRLNAAVVDLEPTASGRGYRLIAGDGGVFSFGDAVFAGSLSGTPLGVWNPPRPG